MTVTIGRRELLVALGGAATWPIVTRAQQREHVRRIGVLMGWSDDAVHRSYFSALIQELARLGWSDGDNARIVLRWTDANIDRARGFAKEMVEQKPDVIIAATTPVTAALHDETTTIPIVFVVVSDPVGAGFVASLARPGTNLTGFINIEAAMGGKWLNLLKEIAPRIKRGAIMFNPDTAPGGGNYFLGSFEAAARALAIESVTTPVQSDPEIEAAITSLGREQASLVLMTDSFLVSHLRTIVLSVTRNNVPAIFDPPSFPREGGLMSYGPNYPDMFRRVAGHIDRILRVVRPADLPVEAPIKFNLVINLKTAATLGLTVPPTLLALADEVIE
jgi:putative tryptophan/tyrosine transport system substrate-binding protein